MEDRLIVGLNINDAQVSGIVLNMPEKLRGEGILARLNGALISSIRSAGHPQLSQDRFYVRGGNRSTDNWEFSHVFMSKEIARQAIINIKTLVRIVNIKDPKEDFVNGRFDYIAQ